MVDTIRTKTLAMTLRLYRFILDNPQGCIIGYKRGEAPKEHAFAHIHKEVGLTIDAIESALSFLKAVGLVYESRERIKGSSMATMKVYKAKRFEVQDEREDIRKVSKGDIYFVDDPNT
jgi:DNA-binding transcriptional ArsR family regulator